MFQAARNAATPTGAKRLAQQCMKLLTLVAGICLIQSSLVAQVPPIKPELRGLLSGDGLPGEEVNAPPRRRFEIPLAPPQGEIKFNREGDVVSLIVRDAAVNDVLSTIARDEGLNLVCTDDVKTRISVTLRNVKLEDALSAVAEIGGCTWTNRRGIVHVSSLGGTAKLSPAVQGRQVQVFHLDYASADDVNQAIAGMLSSLGTSHVIASSTSDNRKTKESIVVEDLPEFIDRIARYIAQMDIPPRQVMVQVHVLQVDLKEEDRHGVNLEHLMNIGKHKISLRVGGFANSGAPQAFFAELSGGNMSSLIEALKTSTDAKTLASPRLMVLNGQEAKIQVGEQLGFRVTTTTQTSTLESVEFLDLGVVLSVTPRISKDNHVLLQVKPEVSSGRVNSDTGLPEEETSEVETNVLLQSGQGIVIGGLIQEKDSNVQSKVHHLGDLHVIGKLFGRRQLEKRRSEIIFLLQPYILPYGPELQAREEFDMMRGSTPLLQGPLERVYRPWEPQLADCERNPKPIRLPAIARGFSSASDKISSDDCISPSYDEPVRHQGVPQPVLEYAPGEAIPTPPVPLTPAPVEIVDPEHGASSHWLPIGPGKTSLVRFPPVNEPR